MGLPALCYMAFNKLNYNRPRVRAHGHKQEIIMDILYILEVISYLVVIPLGVVMMRLFHIEAAKRQNDIRIANRQMKMAEELWK